MSEEEEIKKILEMMETQKAPEGFHERLMSRIDQIENEKLRTCEPIIKRSMWIKIAIVLSIGVILLIISNISVELDFTMLSRLWPSSFEIPSLPLREIAFVLVPLFLLLIDSFLKYQRRVLGWEH